MSRIQKRAGDRPPAEAGDAPDWRPTHTYGAMLRVHDAAGRHEEIARVTGLMPTEAHVRGERQARWTEEQWEHDLWMLASPLPRHAELSAHLHWLWERVAPHTEYFRSLVASGVAVDVWCSYLTDCDHCGFTLQPGATEIAGGLGVPLHVSTIFLGRDDE